MELFQAEEKIPYSSTVVALGNFDGLHIAHMKIIHRAIDHARATGAKSGILLFEDHSESVIGNREVSLITPNEAKLELLAREHPDFVYLKKFTPEFMHLTPRQFVGRLVERLHIKAVCVGYDYRFGYRAEGDVEALRRLGGEFGFEVFVTEAVHLEGHIVSSTYIRELIHRGEMRRAEAFLGRRFCVEGRVVHGLKNGRKMGFPTANVDYDPFMAIPKEGVYAGVSYVGGGRYKSVVNVGKNPTFDAQKTTIESHILDFDQDIYGEYIRISFCERLRGDQRFDSMQALSEQIRRDKESVMQMDL
jgi:riboflavin kinase/FMN adenylyltransferase